MRWRHDASRCCCLWATIFECSTGCLQLACLFRRGAVARDASNYFVGGTLMLRGCTAKVIYVYGVIHIGYGGPTIRLRCLGGTSVRSTPLSVCIVRRHVLDAVLAGHSLPAGLSRRSGALVYALLKSTAQMSIHTRRKPQKRDENCDISYTR